LFITSMLFHSSCTTKSSAGAAQRAAIGCSDGLGAFLYE
jgi:hypothetical protein